MPSRGKTRISISPVSLTRKTRWEGGTLVTEVEFDHGPKIDQTYARSEGGSQLIITTTMKNPRADRPIELKRVYDPADPNLL